MSSSLKELTLAAAKFDRDLAAELRAHAITILVPLIAAVAMWGAFTTKVDANQNAIGKLWTHVNVLTAEVDNNTNVSSTIKAHQEDEIQRLTRIEDKLDRLESRR
jgi:hypothetical protein